VSLPDAPDLDRHGYRCEVRALICKKENRTDALDMRRWINLVDSELWAIRRWFAQRTPDGRRLDALMKEWRDAGCPADEQALSQELLDSVSEKTPGVPAYWEHVLMPMQNEQRRVQRQDDPWHHRAPREP
jgi:hypothetical protein